MPTGPAAAVTGRNVQRHLDDTHVAWIGGAGATTTPSTTGSTAPSCRSSTTASRRLPQQRTSPEPVPRAHHSWRTPHRPATTGRDLLRRHLLSHHSSTLTVSFAPVGRTMISLTSTSQGPARVAKRDGGERWASVVPDACLVLLAGESCGPPTTRKSPFSVRASIVPVGHGKPHNCERRNGVAMNNCRNSTHPPQRTRQPSHPHRRGLPQHSRVPRSLLAVPRAAVVWSTSKHYGCTVYVTRPTFSRSWRPMACRADSVPPRRGFPR